MVVSGIAELFSFKFRPIIWKVFLQTRINAYLMATDEDS